MINKLKAKIKKNTEIFALTLLIIITIISTTYYNYSKKKVYSNYKNTINNIYFKKSVSHLFDSLEPKYKKINHKIIDGETFNTILEGYSLSTKEINEIKSKLSKKINLNKLNTSHKIEFTIDQSTNLIREFIFQISNTEKIYLNRNYETDEFNQKILVTRLNKDIVYRENIILQSLYKSAVKEEIPINTIIEFARIYGFQVDFQRDIRKKIVFKLCMKFLLMMMEK